jgi:hypothetical protein
MANLSPASAGLSSASTGQNRQHNSFPSALDLNQGLSKTLLRAAGASMLTARRDAV